MIESCFGMTLSVASDSTSRVAFDRARHWLSSCVENDVQCRTEELGTRPRRLLRLGPAELVVHLFETEELAGCSEYACLSYCWGPDTADVLKTTSSNIQAHYDGVQVEKLPKTIVDAIKVCRELGISNLWVDSLCIIQNDPHDFAAEGSKMGAIYSGSHLTIYAKAPSSCKQGFLGPQSLGITQWLAPGSAPNGMRFYIRPEEEIGADTAESGLALDSRGWCLQESILSKRQLIYYGTEMGWSCNCRRICECGHVLTPDFLSYLCEDTYAPEHERLLHPSTPLHPYEVLHAFDHVKQWKDIVQDYSCRLLTRSTDKLPAVSGLATRLLELARERNGIQDSYLAGLWESALLDQLCWTAAGQLEDVVSFVRLLGNGRRLENGTPTWSWASIEGHVKYLDDPEANSFRRRTGHTHARVIEARCHPLHPGNPMGSVDEGYIVLEAPLVPVELAIFEEDFGEGLGPETSSIGGNIQTYALVRGKTSAAVDIILDIRLEPTFHLDSPCVKCWESRTVCVREDCAYKSLKDRTQYYCCRLQTWLQDEEYRRKVARSFNQDGGKVSFLKDSPVTHFLLLEKTTGGDAYRRLGFGSFSSAIKPEDVEGNSLLPFMNHRAVWPLFDGQVMQKVRII
ncbi:HET-domain-containing protein [Thozetella sp. PMI_491]|nr:HET-domain-containing protein [Thozetella sp. PMI_491]